MSAGVEIPLPAYAAFKTVAVYSPAPYVYKLLLNRPKKLNAMNRLFWTEFRQCIAQIGLDPLCRVVLVGGAGKGFTSGLDVFDHMDTLVGDGDVGRRALMLGRFLASYQATFSCMEDIPQPILACVHGACIGGGIDLITACDMRVCTADAYFSIKEVDIGLVADVGTIQRLPKIVGNHSLIREWAFTGRNVDSAEALSSGLVHRVLPDEATMWKKGLELAALIASKSPIAVTGTKRCLNFSRDHSVEEGLRHVQVWNGAMLQSEDLKTAAQSMMMKEKPIFANL